MNNKIILIVAMVLAVAFTTTKAQNITASTISWNANSVTDVQAGETKDEWTIFKTFGNNRIEWKVPDGTLLKTYTITATTGAWTNVGQNGEIRFDVTEPQGNGSVVIQRTGTEIRFRFIMVKSTDADAEPEIKEFAISHFTVQ